MGDYLSPRGDADNGGKLTAFVKDGGSQQAKNFLDILYKRGAAGTANANRVLYYIRLKPEFVACGANTNCINGNHNAKLTTVGGSSFVRGAEGLDPNFEANLAAGSYDTARRCRPLALERTRRYRAGSPILVPSHSAPPLECRSTRHASPPPRRSSSSTK